MLQNCSVLGTHEITIFCMPSVLGTQKHA